jgi:hypothetical protein
VADAFLVIHLYNEKRTGQIGLGLLVLSIVLATIFFSSVQRTLRPEGVS